MGEIGQIVAGRYRLEARLGAGGMGTVWRAQDMLLDRVVAIKELRFSQGLTDEQHAEVVQRAVAEASHAGRIDHPNVVRVQDVVTDNERPWIVMQLVEGRSLEQIINAEGAWAPERVAQLASWMIGALSAAHAAGLIHRDVKPSNVLIPDSGGALLTDFSVAKVLGSGTMTNTGMLLGTPGFIAPERILNGVVGMEADLFALGATLYFAAEGVSPFASDDPVTGAFAPAIRQHDPPQRAGEMASIIDRLLIKDPRERATLADLQAHVQQHFPGSDAPAPVAVPPPPRATPIAVPLPPPMEIPLGSAWAPAIIEDNAELEPLPPKELDRRRIVLAVALAVVLLLVGSVVLTQVLDGGKGANGTAAPLQSQSPSTSPSPSDTPSPSASASPSPAASGSAAPVVGEVTAIQVLSNVADGPSCKATISARVTVSGPAEVRLQTEINGGSDGTKTLSFTEAGQKTIQLSSTSSVSNGSATVRSTAPNSMQASRSWNGIPHCGTGLFFTVSGTVRCSGGTIAEFHGTATVFSGWANTADFVGATVYGQFTVTGGAQLTKNPQPIGGSPLAPGQSRTVSVDVGSRFDTGTPIGQPYDLVMKPSSTSTPSASNHVTGTVPPPCSTP
ncbi:protein kinase [Rhizocola hellebori]|uniref:non-specific serine/threonine protein kinase n=1 Tax=Rhizocola hellebori TaxID=1392758 RepID=A0A8J3Q4R6_9ACTN|nr:serine/threonine-protein kinase [Rhizocola hellebori]GIH03948.1 protein kinase [Rhizocola hellebori]